MRRRSISGRKTAMLLLWYGGVTLAGLVALTAGIAKLVL